MAWNHRIKSFFPTMLVCMVVVLTSTTAYSQAGFTLSSNLTYSDNPLFAANLNGSASDVSDYISTTAATISLDRQTKYAGTTLNYGANRREFRYDVGNDQGQISGTGIFLIKAIPDLFVWQFGNTRSTQLIDASLPNIPDNQQDIENWFTGPQISLPLDSATFMRFSSEHGIVGFEETGLLDQGRDSYNLSVTRIISKRLTGTLVLSQTNTAFDNLPGSDYSFLNASVSMQFESQDYSLTAEAGQYTTERTGQRSTHPSFRLSGQLRVNSRLEVTGDFSRSVDDLLSNVRNPGRVDQFFDDTVPELGATFGNSNNPNLFVRDNLSFGLAYNAASAFRVNLRYGVTERSSVFISREENDQNLSASINLPLPAQPRLTVSASARLSTRSFSQRGEQDRTEVQIRAGYRLSESFNLNFFASDTSQTAEFDLDNFDGASIGFGFTYSRLML